MMLSSGRRWAAVAALALSLLVVGMDITVLNLALPDLSASLSASTSDLQWIVDAYTLVFRALLLPAGLLGDRFGRKRLLVVALACFGAASVACAYAPTTGALIAARVGLGVGAAFLMPLAIGVLPAIFSEAERPRAVTVLMTSTMAAFPIGPLLGGWLLDHFWWGSVFLINVPAVVVALVAVLVLLPESRSASRPVLDPAGIALSSVGLVGVTYGVIKAGEDDWGDGVTLAALAVGVVALAAFVTWERGMSSQALLDLGLFKSRSFTLGTLLATALSFALIGVLFTTPQYLQAVQGTDALGAGIRLLPMIGGLLLGGSVADRLGRAAGAKVTVAVGFAALTAGFLLGASTSAGSGTAFVCTWLAVTGVGLGLALPASMDAALGALSPERSGTGSAVIMAVRQVGGTFGVALLGSLVNSAYRDRLDLTGLPHSAAHAARESVTAGVAVAHKLGSDGLLHSVRDAFTHGLDLTLLVSAGITIAGAAVALAMLPSRAPGEPDTERSGQSLDAGDAAMAGLVLTMAADRITRPTSADGAVTHLLAAMAPADDGHVHERAIRAAHEIVRPAGTALLLHASRGTRERSST